MKKVKLILLVLFGFLLNNITGQTVTICNGKYSIKYHSSTTCRGLNNGRGGLSEVTLAKAVSIGRTPCLLCHPPTVSTNVNNQPSNQYRSEGQLVQCSATTKAGTQCKRMTRSSNGLCWQHGGN